MRYVRGFSDRALLALHPAQAGDQWREAVEERFAVNHTDMPEDPREAIKKLIATEVRDALDPTISSAAAALAQAGVPDDIVKNAQRWRKHAEVMKAATMPDSLRISMTINKDGQTWGNELVLSTRELGSSILGVRYVGMQAEKLFEKLDAMLAAAPKEGGAA